MKNTLSIILATALIVTGVAVKVSAQNHPEETASAQAAYGVTTEPAKYRLKKREKMRKHKKHHAHAKAAKSKTQRFRKRENWAG